MSAVKLPLTWPQDVRAFDELVARHEPRLYRLAFRMLRQREEAEDVVQEAFVKAFEALPSLRAPKAFPAWLQRIAVTLCLTRLRSARRGREISLEDSAFASLADTLSSQLDDGRLVRAALADLPPHYRALLEACYVHGYTYAELAAFAGLEMPTLKARLFRARRCLRKRLREILDEDGPAAS
jgi:RNA polymerase sigma factor (sigma-70 family)